MNDTLEIKLQESARLLALYNLNKGDLTQAEFGERYGIGSQGMVSQYLRGVRHLNLQAAKKFAEGLGIEIAEFSPRLAEPFTAVLPPSTDSVQREMVSVLVRPDLKGKMQLLKGKMASEGKDTKLYMLYEEALIDLLNKHGIKTDN